MSVHNDTQSPQQSKEGTGLITVYAEPRQPMGGEGGGRHTNKYTHTETHRQGHTHADRQGHVCNKNERKKRTGRNNEKAAKKENERASVM